MLESPSPHPPAGPRTVASTADVEATWAGIYDAMMRAAPRRPDALDGPDYSGWRSAVTGADYPDEHIRSWAEGTVQRVLSTHPASILEVGAGSGILALPLSGRVARYDGCDLSQGCVERLRALPVPRAESCFSVRSAVDLEGLPRADMVLLNSVIHHFPDGDYLERALTLAVEHLEPGGCVFVGDVVDLGLREAYWLDVVAGRVAAPAPVRSLLTQWAGRSGLDVELSVLPGFFVDFAHRNGMVADVRLKPTGLPVEMSTYRYDVWIRPAGPAPIIDPETLPRVPWSQDALSDARGPGKGPVLITDVPHPTRSRTVGALAELRATDPGTTIDLAALLARQAVGVPPGEIQRQATEHGSQAVCLPSTTRADRYDVVLGASTASPIRFPAGSQPIDGTLTSNPRVAFARLRARR